MRNGIKGVLKRPKEVPFQAPFASEWNTERNAAQGTFQMAMRSPRKVWWKCARGHEWQATVETRRRGHGCPKCGPGAASFPEQALYYYMRQCFPDTVHRYELVCMHELVELDLFVPSQNLAVEFDGPHHQGRQARDEHKNFLMQHRGIQLIRIRAKSLPLLNAYGSICIEMDNYEVDALEVGIQKLLQFIEQTCSLTDGELICITRLAQVNLRRDEGRIRQQL